MSGQRIRARESSHALSFALALLATLPCGSASAEPITLEQAVVRALGHNLELKIERAEPLVARERIREAEAEFGHFVEFSTDYLDSERFANSILETAPELMGGTINEKRYTLKAGSGKRFTSGAEYRFGIETPIIDTNHPLRLFDRSYTPRLTVTVKQPLMRDAGKGVNRVRIEQAERLERETLLEIERKAIELIHRVETSYWTLAYAQGHLAAAETTLRLSEQRIEGLKKLTGVGLEQRSDVLLAEMVVEEHRAEVAQARTDLTKEKDRLRFLIGTQAALSVDRDLPADRPSEDLDLLVQRALRMRPEIKIQAIAIEGLELEERLAHNNRLWRLDAVGNTGYSGLAGEEPVDAALFPLPSQLIERNSYFEAFQDGALSWSVGLQMSVPLGQRKALARLEPVQLRLHQERLRLALLRGQIEAEVEAAFHDETAGWARLQSARRSVALARENLTAIESNLANGLATEDELLEGKVLLSSTLDRESRIHLLHVLSRSRLKALEAATVTFYDVQVLTE